MTSTWAGQPNGQIDLARMVPVEGHYFEPVTAACVAACVAAARAAGHAITITQGYRALGSRTDSPKTEPVTQWSAWNAYQQKVPLPGASVVATAAYPGTSNHGDGTAADFTGTGWHPFTPLSRWLQDHAGRYGIVFDVPSESWHGHRKNAPTVNVAALTTTPIDASESELPDMKVILHTTHDANGTVTGVLNYLVGELTLHPLRTQQEVDTATAAYGPAVPVDDARFDLFSTIVAANVAAVRGAAGTVTIPPLTVTSTITAK